ncbi:CotH kinase family protein [Zhihengliuella flava]|uniref:Spore coat protein CotH n=1 Tax=Zhihengliuella flava TaxID=1285193 RepID=A0A931D9L4_9MICC|nr:CotH kinase family protein [Zhihengliuella flava]MBG6084952.1 spore coat protein CotH [Zhihengliuella flava]
MTTPRPRRRLATAITAGVAASLLLSSCSGSLADALQIETSAADSASEASQTSSFFNSTDVHEVSVEADQEQLDAALDAYAADGSKEWVEATVTIDGTVYENVGLRLKGNSSLRGTSADSDPTDLPWLIRLDKYVDGQQHAGRADYVVRQNNTETSLNEAVALELIGAAGLETEEAAATRFSVNGAEAQLRLVIDAPDDPLWNESYFTSEGITYEAESSGDYSYRGDAAEDYAEAFSVKDGEEDMTPLIEFLDFVNNSSDEDFAAHLEQYLDVDSFATYLALQDLVGNTDDIDGPGNNSFLRYDEETGQMTVLTWDMNLSFGTMGGMGGGERGQFPGGEAGEDGQFPADGEMPEGFEPLADGEMPEGFEPPAEGEMPEGFEPPAEGERPAPGDGTGTTPDAGGAGGPGGGSNPLVERFLADEGFAELYSEAQERLQSELIDSGAAEDIVNSWSTLLQDEASDLVEAATVTTEADSILDQLGTSTD